MQGLVFYLFLPFIYLISFFPFSVLYKISDLIYFFLYYVIRYRKKIILGNLGNAFPNKSTDEIKKISKKYYSYLSDIIIETIKALTIGKDQLLKRCSLTPDSLFLLDSLYKQNKSIIVVSGHYGNWEWGGYCLNLQAHYLFFLLYKPLSNKYFDKLMYKMRTRFGAGLVPMSNVLREMHNNKEKICATGFISDQSPSPDNAYWTTFLNQETPVFSGIEKIARKFNYPVVFVNFNPIQRGHYIVTAELLFANPQDTKDGEITEGYTRRLEQDIIKKPSFWLWSHRRWKHKKNNSK